MAWVAAAIGLVGVFGLVAGAVLLRREARAVLTAGESDADGATPEPAARGFVGVVLLIVGAIITYVALAIGGYLAPW